MTRRSGLSRWLGAALALAAGGGCSLLVSGDVPDFQCLPGSDSACPSGMVCNASSRCVFGEAGVLPDEAGDMDAAAEAAPDAKPDADAATVIGDLGAKCRVDAECRSHLCGASNILTTTITATTGPICTIPCCGSADCPSTFVCFNGGTGGGYCVPGALASRTPPSTGGKIGGTVCSANSECRSGLCAVDGASSRCLDTCCTPSECGGASTCRVATVSAPGPAHDVWVCAVPDVGATGQPGDTCLTSSDCISSDCVGSGTRICRPGCSNTASCQAVSGFSSGHCLYGPSGSDVLKFCFNVTFTSRSPNGDPCTDKSTCQSDYCDGDLKKCLNVCARDTDCAANESCRPAAANTPYLRCVPKP